MFSTSRVSHYKQSFRTFSSKNSNKKSINQKHKVLPRGWWLNDSNIEFIADYFTAKDLSGQPSIMYKNNNMPETNQTTFTPRIPDADLNMIGGNMELLDAAADLVRYLQNPAGFTRLGAKPPKGIILSGPPGVGKTFLAEAIAGHAGAAFISVSASDCIGSYVGETENKLRKIFAMSNELKPCVLCIDEIESLGNKRFDSPRQAYEHSANTIVNQLLTLLEKSHPGLIVIATTNNYNTLDSALVRPGRFDRHIFVAMPNLSDREHILSLHVKNMKLHRNVSLKELAALSPGFSGAKLVSWISEAAIVATKRGADSISMDDFDEARTLIQVGVKRQHHVAALHKRWTAIHEAGHALIGHLLQAKIYRISIITHGNADGFTEFLPKENDESKTQQESIDEICRMLAGRAAEKVVGTLVCGSQSDLEGATRIAYHLVKNEGMGSTLTGITMNSDVEKMLQQQMERAVSLLQQHKHTLNTLANALLKHGELKRNDFLAIVEGRKMVSSLNAERAAKKTISLPPKTNRSVISEFTSFFKQANNITEELPFTFEQVAKALDIKTSNIRKISFHEGACFVELKPSFTHHKHMDQMSEMMRQYDVDSYYSEVLNHTLTIKEGSLEDFKQYVKFRNESNNQNKM